MLECCHHPKTVSKICLAFLPIKSVNDGFYLREAAGFSPSALENHRCYQPWSRLEPAASPASPTKFLSLLGTCVLLFVSFLIQPNLTFHQNFIRTLHKSCKVAATRSFPESQKLPGFSCQEVVCITAESPVVACTVLHRGPVLD